MTAVQRYASHCRRRRQHGLLSASLVQIRPCCAAVSGHGGGEGGIMAQPPGRRGHFPPDWMKCTSTEIALQHLVILMGRGSGVRATVLGRLLYRLKNESAASELFSYNPTPCPPGPLPTPLRPPLLPPSPPLPSPAPPSTGCPARSLRARLSFVHFRSRAEGRAERQISFRSWL